ncbi:MAG: TonB family protein, partial [Pseudomonadota bacterium]
MKRPVLFCLVALCVAPPALAAGLTKLPKQVVSVEAAYPPEAAAAGIEADVILNLTIDTTGHVSHADVATSAGPGREAFDAAAVAAASGYLFEPA